MFVVRLDILLDTFLNTVLALKGGDNWHCRVDAGVPLWFVNPQAAIIEP